ncbi:hypothetical protein B0H14DRAFT_2770402 [Mycena olivaceomarginata]|nr:hypothetical protein B0H14DRAFT_2770402 [Mycena olivaceomarginata]
MDRLGRGKASVWIQCTTEGFTQRCMNFVPAILIGRLCDLGYFRATFATGCILIIIGTFLISICTVYWHFLLCQGFMMGVSGFSVL